ncbi:MAG: sarcosine oxidase subunit gamma [Rhodobacteraceae bacterium]|nr:sarcosine oxidase subunit gamma [Paracoccaceae bacterium]
MSEVTSALAEASFSGIATIRDCGLAGMITIRGTLADKGFAAAVTKATGCTIPSARGVEAGTLAWMSPDEVLWLCDHADAATQADALADALSGQHAMVTNVSDARALFAVEGPNAREVLAKLCPADVSPAAFGPGRLIRSHLGQVPAAMWQTEDGVFHVICFRSVAQYVFDLLSVAAQPGSEPHLWS